MTNSPKQETYMNQFLRRTVAISVACTLASSPVLAGTAPGNLADLTYQESDWAKEQMRSRGYTRIHGDWHNNRNWTYWWSNAGSTCIKMQDDGRTVQSLVTTVAMDCNQKESDDNKSGMSTGAKVAIGAAALIGVALLASKSHQRGEKHSQDEKSTAEFERGYRDGLHHERYHNYQNTSAYSDGYNAGQQKRDQETSYRSNSGYHSGYQSYVSLDDLVDARASSAEGELQSRGFRHTGGYQQGNKAFTTWWNERTRQCVQAVTKEGRIKRFESINEGNCI